MRLPWHRPTPPPPAELTGWFKPQAPAARPQRVPGPNPGAGAAPPAVEAANPRAASPGTGPKLTITIEFYDDGSSKVLDHTRRRRFVIPGAAGPTLDLSDEALARFLNDLR